MSAGKAKLIEDFALNSTRETEEEWMENQLYSPRLHFSDKKESSSTEIYK